MRSPLARSVFRVCGAVDAASRTRFLVSYFNFLRLNPASTNLRTSSATDSPVFLLSFSKASR